MHVGLISTAHYNTANKCVHICLVTNVCTPNLKFIYVFCHVVSHIVSHGQSSTISVGHGPFWQVNRSIYTQEFISPRPPTKGSWMFPLFSKKSAIYTYLEPEEANRHSIICSYSCKINLIFSHVYFYLHAFWL